ncbi:hypothetical protein ACFE04_024208 [Oxalis oulophora]
MSPSTNQTNGNLNALFDQNNVLENHGEKIPVENISDGDEIPMKISSDGSFSDNDNSLGVASFDEIDSDSSFDAISSDDNINNTFSEGDSSDDSSDSTNSNGNWYDSGNFHFLIE